MPSPNWVEWTLADVPWTEIPLEWLLDGSTGLGQYVAVSYGEGIVESTFVSGPDPAWTRCSVTPQTWGEQTATPQTWTEVRTDS